MIKLITKYTKGIVSDSVVSAFYQNKINRIYKKLNAGTAKGWDMTGWIPYVQNYDKNVLKQMKDVANKWKASHIKKVVVVGIGGSYIGIKAGIDMLSSEYVNRNFQILFAHNMNQNYLWSLLNSLGNDPFGIIVISKSGTTLEPAIALNLFFKRLVRNVGEKKANKLVVAITDKVKGNLLKAAKENDWPHFVIPSDVGGRYSALTPAGMFLYILLDLNYHAIIDGANDAIRLLSNPEIKKNDAIRYACYRNYFRTYQHYDIENFIVYDPGLEMMCQVWKQLFGESEGKDHKALYPSISLFTTDLHSMGQYFQEGTRNFFETTLFVKQPIKDLKVYVKDDDINFLNGKKLSYINKVAMFSTIKAHYEEGKVNNMIIYVDKQDAYHFGYLYTWLCFAAMTSAYLLRLNPFDQPGVEIYKKRIASTLKKK